MRSIVSITAATGLRCSALTYSGSVTLDIPEELLGDEQYTTVNGNMKALTKRLGQMYTAITQAASNVLDIAGIISYYGAIPDWVWETDDRYTMMMQDYQYWDAKNRAVLEAFRPNIAAISNEDTHTFWQLMLEGQDTNITAEDIALWSQTALSLAEEPYLTIPGFEGVVMRDFNAGALTGVSGYDAKMLAYNNTAIAEAIRVFIYGQ